MKPPADTHHKKDPRRVVRLLQVVTLLRSIGQGASLTITSLYLRELGWSGATIGAVIAASSIVRVVFALLGGVLSARLGAKRCLLLFETLTFGASCIMAATSAPWLLVAAVTIAGLGSGHSGSGGPTAPIERAWLGAYARDPAKAKALYSRNALYSYVGLGTGALLACIPGLLDALSEDAISFRLLYLLIAIITVGCIICIGFIQGGARKLPTAASLTAPALTSHLDISEPATARSNQLRMLASSLSGVTATLTSTVTAYWFAERFGVSSGVIGLVMGISYWGAALIARLTSGGSGREAALRTIISLQFAAIALLLILPWVSVFWLAALIEMSCTACNLGTRGHRTALMMEERGRGKRDLLSRVNMIAVRLTAVLWPGIFVHFVDEGYYVPPFYFAAAMQLTSALLFRRVYRTTPHDRAQIEAKHQETTTV